MHGSMLEVVERWWHMYRGSTDLRRVGQPPLAYGPSPLVGPLGEFLGRYGAAICAFDVSSPYMWALQSMVIHLPPLRKSTSLIQGSRMALECFTWIMARLRGWWAP
jgi:hypothetical protein